MKETESSAQTPEQLLQFLSMEAELNRNRRERSRKGRGLILAFGILLILIGAVVSLFVLSSMVKDLPRPQGTGNAPDVVAVQS